MGILNKKIQVSKNLLIISLVGLTAISTCLTGVLTYHFTKKNDKQIYSKGVSPLVTEIYNYLVEKWLYAGDIEDLEQKLNTLMINGMLDNDGDPYTFYTSNYGDQNLNTSGSGAYGFTYNYYTAFINNTSYGGLLIKDIYEGSFKKAGFKENDIIIASKFQDENDFKYFENYSTNSLTNLIYPDENAKNKEVTFKIIRDNNFLDINAEASYYSKIPASLVYEDDKTLGIRISSFLGDNDSSYPAIIVKKILEEKTKNKTYENLVFDLRNNGGGFTSQASDLACLFLPKGSIIYQEGTEKQITKTYYQNQDPEFGKDKIKNIKIIINGGSASATELFTSALIENNLATTYGSKSYGKGIAQSIINLQNGGTLRLTTSKIYTPKGNSIHKVGITPDYIVNDFEKFGTNLVSNCYLEDSYRLTYEEEEKVKNSILRVKNYTETTYADLVTHFQQDNNIDVTGNYDSKTVYRLYYANLEKYNLGYNNLANDIYKSIL